jgi:DNA-binding transcriptional regulator YdaS (Cro superfamily)
MSRTKKKKSAEYLDQVLEIVGGATALAAACGLTEGAVRYWIEHGRVASPTAARFLEHHMMAEHEHAVAWSDLFGEGYRGR